VQRHSSAALVSPGSSRELTVAGGMIGSTVILASVAVGQSAGFGVALGFTLFVLWQFWVFRDCRGPAGAPELQRVVWSSEQSFKGRRRS
jgi:hypothetical protein